MKQDKYIELAESRTINDDKDDIQIEEEKDTLHPTRSTTRNRKETK